MQFSKRVRSYGLVAALVMLGVGAGVLLAQPFLFAVENESGSADRARLAELCEHDKLSALFREVARVVKPAVVVVHVKQEVAFNPSPPSDQEEFLRRFFGDDLPGPFRFRWETPEGQPQRRYYRRGMGSGVIIDAEHGYVLTNWHVVRSAEHVQVILADGRDFDAEWVRTDQQTDLAVVKIPSGDLTEAVLGDSESVQVGDWVLAIGAPEGLPQTVTAGIISAMGRTTGRGGYEDFIQTDAAINQGNSGGPLVNMRGEVIGINTAIVSRTGVNEGIGLSIPSNMVKRIMEQLIATGEVVRGYLGVQIQDVDQDLVKSFDLPDTNGALISQVAAKTPAEAAGLKPGDFIVSLDGEAVENVNRLRNRVAAVRPGTSVKLEVYRDGKKRTVEVRIGKQPADFASVFTEGAPGGTGAKAADRFGLEVATMGTQYAEQFGIDATIKGAVILSVNPGSEAGDKGLQPGDVITQVDGQDVTSADELTQVLASDKADDGVRLQVRGRRGGVRFVFIAPKAG